MLQPSIYKSLSLSIFLYFSAFAGFTTLASWGFFILGLTFFMLDFKKLKPLFFSYSVLTIFSFLSLNLIASSSISPNLISWISALYIFCFFALFWFLLEKADLLKTQDLWYLDIFNSVLLFLASGSIFAISPGLFFGYPALLLFFVFSGLLVEFFSLRGFSSKRVYLFSAVASLLSFQLGYFFKLLPVSLFNTAVLVAFFTILNRRFFHFHLKGQLTLKSAFKHLIVFLGLSLTVFIF